MADLSSKGGNSKKDASAAGAQSEATGMALNDHLSLSSSINTGEHGSHSAGDPDCSSKQFFDTPDMTSLPKPEPKDLYYYYKELQSVKVEPQSIYFARSLLLLVRQNYLEQSRCLMSQMLAQSHLYSSVPAVECQPVSLSATKAIDFEEASYSVSRDEIQTTNDGAFWDGITEQLKQDPPNYGLVILFVEKIQNELYEMAAKSWQLEIFDSVDIAKLHQVMVAGNPDMADLRRFLEYAMAILQKFSVPTDDNKVKKRHERLLNELSEIENSDGSSNNLFVIALVKGLRFLVEQIQILKLEISEAQIMTLEPIISGLVCLEYLRKAFWNNCEVPVGALASLPSLKWLNSKEDAKHEWDVNMRGISTLLGDLPQTLEGERVHELLKVGQLKLVTEIAGLSPKCLPETLQLNLSESERVQRHLQKIILLLTRLTFRQMLLTECSGTQAGDVDVLAEVAMRRFSDLLDSKFNVGIPAIIQMIFWGAYEGGEVERCQKQKDLMARNLAENFKDSDRVFLRSVYQATMAIFLSGTCGEELADVELGRGGDLRPTKKAKIQKTIQVAFWDEFTERLKQDPPDYGLVICLVEKIRNELCVAAPEIWAEEIFDIIDIDNLHLVLEFGKLDMAHLRGFLEYALTVLQKLSAPSEEEEIKKRHARLLDEISEIANSESSSNKLFGIALVKGLRFVVEQIQILKQNIRSAWKSFELFNTSGAGGLEYLQKAFRNRYGDPAGAWVSLSSTKKWLKSVKETADPEWDLHIQGICDLRQTCSVGVDVILRVGLLKLVMEFAELTPECLPETLQMNFSMLRAIQGQLRRIIVISTSSLTFQRMLLTECSDTRADIDALAEDAMRRLWELLDSNLDVGIPEIIQMIFRESPGGGVDERCQLRKDLLARMLAESLKDSDPVFLKVSRAVYRATRAIVFYVILGDKLADLELRRVRASMLTKKLVEAANILINVIAVSYRVYGPWYATLTENL